MEFILGQPMTQIRKATLVESRIDILTKGIFQVPQKVQNNLDFICHVGFYVKAYGGKYFCTLASKA